MIMARTIADTHTRTHTRTRTRARTHAPARTHAHTHIYIQRIMDHTQTSEHNINTPRARIASYQ